jgi:hypothetical protein
MDESKIYLKKIRKKKKTYKNKQVIEEIIIQ